MLPAVSYSYNQTSEKAAYDSDDEYIMVLPDVSKENHTPTKQANDSYNEYSVVLPDVMTNTILVLLLCCTNN